MPKSTLKILEDAQEFHNTPIGSAKRKGDKKGRKGSKHDPYRKDPPQVSEEAFTLARGRMPFSFWLNLIIILGESSQEEHDSLLKRNAPNDMPSDANKTLGTLGRGGRGRLPSQACNWKSA